jgi:hypothetical protein
VQHTPTFHSCISPVFMRLRATAECVSPASNAAGSDVVQPEGMMLGLGPPARDVATWANRIFNSI